MRFLLLSTALLASTLLPQAQAQSEIRQSFEGTTPFATIPAAGTFSSVTTATLGDVGVFTSASGINPAHGSQFAVLTTFSDGAGTYAPGSQLFAGGGAVSGPNNLWNFAFPGSAVNSLIGMGAASGSVVTVSLALEAGQSVFARLAFATSEVSAIDLAWVGVRATGSTEPSVFQDVTPLGLSATPLSVLNFDSMSPWFGFSFQAPAANTYTLAFGVADRGSEGGQSALFLDMIAIPEPGTWAALAGATALGAAVLIRRRRTS